MVPEWAHIITSPHLTTTDQAGASGQASVGWEVKDPGPEDTTLEDPIAEDPHDRTTPIRLLFASNVKVSRTTPLGP